MKRARPQAGSGAAAAPTIRRSGIYTRVSTDEQVRATEYNSLAAQEDMCKNYIAIRAMDPAMERKWIYTETYTDPGETGGNMDRPGLQRLLADIRAGKIDVVVVYKVERLTRSSRDFYTMWDLFEEHNVDLASVTQEFNTATSQGRLMLNLLLGFAQYERENSAERTRDKIAASRKKGLWGGGHPVLGYDIDRTRRVLVVNEAETQKVREIFELYLREMSLLRALRAVHERGIRTKVWVTSKGKTNGGKQFDRVTLHELLRNPVYIGKIRHHENVYDGQHQAIIDPATFERVQTMLAGNFVRRSSNAENVNGFLLKGLVKCAACDRAMSPNFAYGRGGRRYLYYKCQTATRQGAEGGCPIRSVSAPALERLLVERLAFLASDAALIERMVAQAGAEANAKLPFLRDERIQLDADLRRRREEARRLMDALAAGDVTGQLVRGRVTEVEEEIGRLERRSVDLDAEIDRLDRSVLSPKQIIEALKDFVSVWNQLSQEEKARLARLAISEIVYDERDKKEGEVTWKFRVLALTEVPPPEGGGFDECQPRRPGANTYRNSTNAEPWRAVRHFRVPVTRRRIGDRNTRTARSQACPGGKGIGARPPAPGRNRRRGTHVSRARGAPWLVLDESVPAATADPAGAGHPGRGRCPDHDRCRRTDRPRHIIMDRSSPRLGRAARAVRCARSHMA
jgi:site-specific DNA recombinase